MSNRFFKLASLSVALIALNACRPLAATDHTGVFGTRILAASPVPPAVITVLNSGIADRRRIVIRTAGEWAAFWSQVSATVSPAPPVPHFDFDSEMLLIASMGTQPSGGYAIDIDSVHVVGGAAIHAVVRETSPGASCAVTGALTAPVVAVRIPRSSAPVQFSTRAVVRSCE